MQSVTNALLNLILVSIPEEVFLVTMTLIFLKRFDMLDIRMWRYNLKWIMIPVLLMALEINTTKYILQLPKIICSLSSLIIFFISFTYIIKKNSYSFHKKDYRKVFLSLSFSFIMLGLMESITAPIILFLLNKPLIFVNNNILWNFIASSPSRILELLVVVFLIIKHNNIVKIQMFDVISKNNFLLMSIILFTILSNVFAVYAIKLIGSDRILENKVSEFGQILISMSILVIPAFILFWVLLLINYILVKEKQIQQTYESLVMRDDVMLGVENQ